MRVKHVAHALGDTLARRGGGVAAQVRAHAVCGGDEYQQHAQCPDILRKPRATAHALKQRDEKGGQFGRLVADYAVDCKRDDQRGEIGEGRRKKRGEEAQQKEAFGAAQDIS